MTFCFSLLVQLLMMKMAVKCHTWNALIWNAFDCITLFLFNSSLIANALLCFHNFISILWHRSPSKGKGTNTEGNDDWPETSAKMLRGITMLRKYISKHKTFSSGPTIKTIRQNIKNKNLITLVPGVVKICFDFKFYKCPQRLLWTISWKTSGGRVKIFT